MRKTTSYEGDREKDLELVLCIQPGSDSAAEECYRMCVGTERSEGKKRVSDHANVRTVVAVL